MKSSRSSVRKKQSSIPIIRNSRSIDKKVAVLEKKKKTLGKTIRKYSKIALKNILLSKTFQVSTKVLLVFMMLGVTLYFSYHLIGKTFANEVVISKSEIVSRAAKRTQLPNEEPYEVVRVQNEEDLKKQNEFYKDVKEGDYIIMYPHVAVVYDLRNDVIVALRRTKEIEEVTSQETKREGIIKSLQAETDQ